MIIGLKKRSGTKITYEEIEVEGRNVKQNSEYRLVTDAQIGNWSNKLEKDEPATQNTVNFAEAKERKNINSGETLSILFGKIRKVITDLKNVAFSGSYRDLKDCPGIANNCTTTAAGAVLDARQGKVLMDKTEEIKSEMGGLKFGEDESGKWVEGADSVRVPLGKLQRKLLGTVSSSGTFDCTSIPGWQNFTIDNFAVVPTELYALGGHWLAAPTGAGGRHSGSCTPSMSYNNATGQLTMSNYYFDNDYSYGDHWTLYCRGQITASVYCFYI